MFTNRFVGRGALVSTMLCLALSPAYAQDSDLAAPDESVGQPTTPDATTPSAETTAVAVPRSTTTAETARVDTAIDDTARVDTAVVDTAIDAPIPEPPSGPQVLASVQDGFGFRSADGRQSLRIGALFSTRIGLDVPDAGDVTPFANVRLARLTVGGQLWGDHVRYFLNAEFAGKPQLLDLEVDLQWRPELQFRIGQFRTPFSRQFIMPLFALQLPDRSIVSDYFRANRDTGISAEGQLFGGRAEYRVGVYNGNGINAGGNDNTKVMVLGRVAVAPLGPVAYDETIARNDGDVRIAFGLGAYHDVKERSHTQVNLDTGAIETIGDPSLDRTAGAFDFVLRAGPFTFSTEAFVDRRRARDVPDQIGVGAFAQAGLFVVPGTFEIAGRFNWLAPNVDDDASRGVERYELGATYYLFDAHLKIQGRYSYDHVDAGLTGMPVATGHGVQLQLLLAL
ncbi:MAG: hypothetical protein H6720_28270 [Sandaracinus sp.]|nr:hypothetical protein [Sandaracinus sp.]